MIKVKNNRKAIKCIKVKYASYFEDVFELVLKELLCAKMACAMKAGAQIDTQLGFSIFVYHDCMEFAME